MKKILLILAFSLVTLGAGAQSFTFGPKIGTNISVNSSIDKNPAWNMGLFFGYEWNKIGVEYLLNIREL